MPDPLHPAIVHFPIVLALLSPVIAGVLFWAIRAGRVPARAWIGVLVFQAILVGSGWLAAETGEHEEERVERVVAEQAIEEHEEEAERFLLIAGLTLPLIAAGLLRPPFGALARGFSIAAALATALAVSAVGHSGGELVYHHGAASAYLDADASAARSGAAGAAHESEDDDD